MDPRSPVAKASAKLPPLRPKAPPLAPFQQFSGEDIVLTFGFFDCEEDELPTSPAATPPEDKCGGGGNKPTKEGVPVKAVPPAKGRGSARHSKAGPIEVSLGSSLFALSLSVSRHGPVGLMLAFGWNFHFGHLDYTFHDGRVVYTVCVRGVRFRFVGGLGAPPSRLATVESGGGGGGIDAAWPPFYIEQCVREAKVRAAKAAATAETAEAKKQRRAESRRRAASEANAARFQARRRRGIRRLREKLRRKGALSATKEAELARRRRGGRRPCCVQRERDSTWRCVQWPRRCA